jgi:threonine/homoserine/homoserine lactone efflux protein
MIMGQFLIGFVFSFVGSAPPGIINVTVAETRIRSGQSAAIWLAAGAALVEWFQAFVAVYFGGLLAQDRWQLAIQVIAIVVFFALGIHSLRLAYKNSGETLSSQLKLPFFWKGVLVSVLNFLAIPYWLVNSAYLNTLGLSLEGMTYLSVFCTGVLFGTFFLLLVYAYLSRFIMAHLKQVVRWTNLSLAAIFLLIATIQLMKLLL